MNEFEQKLKTLTDTQLLMLAVGGLVAATTLTDPPEVHQIQLAVAEELGTRGTKP